MLPYTSQPPVPSQLGFGISATQSPTKAAPSTETDTGRVSSVRSVSQPERCLAPARLSSRRLPTPREGRPRPTQVVGSLVKPQSNAELATQRVTLSALYPRLAGLPKPNPARVQSCLRLDTPVEQETASSERRLGGTTGRYALHRLPHTRPVSSSSVPRLAALLVESQLGEPDGRGGGHLLPATFCFTLQVLCAVAGLSCRSPPRRWPQWCSTWCNTPPRASPVFGPSRRPPCGRHQSEGRFALSPA